MSKRLLFTVFITIALGAVLLKLAYALGVYFLEDRFNVDDAAALADPYSSTGGQSIDVIQVESTLSISSGKLALAAQASPVDGESGVRYATTKPQYIGAGAFAKVVYKTLATGIAASSGASSWIGYNSTLGVGTAPSFGLAAGSAAITSIGTNLTRFLFWPNETVATAWICPVVPTVNDTFYLAILMGGYNEGATTITTAIPWYTGGGLNLGDYDSGHFVYIKKGTGPWIMAGVNPVNSNALDGYFACIGNYNAALEVYDWLVLNDADSAYYPYMQPLLWQSCTASDGTQLYDDVPEVGPAADSVSGNFTITGNATDTDGTGNGIATFALGDDDVVGTVLTNADNTTTGRGCSVVLRRNSGTGEYMMCDLNTTTDTHNIFSFNGTSFTQRATVAVTMTATADFDLALGAAIVDSTMVSWYYELASEVVSLSYTSGSITQFGDNNNNHGIRFGTDGTSQAKFIRFYAAGNDGEYAGLSNFFSRAGKRGKVLIIQ